MLPPAVRLHRIASLFLLIPLAAILFIFLWTEEGVWAESFTAVNRLFIHFAPCWMLLTGLVVWPRISGSRGEFS